MQGNYCYKYPHPGVTADMVAFSFENNHLHLLLIQRKNEPYKDKWAFPGGFMNIDECIEDCAKRELEEETNLITNEIHQIGCFSKVDRDPRERVITIAFASIVKKQEVIGSDDAKKAIWFSIDALPDLAFDHKEILHNTINKLKEMIALGTLEIKEYSEDKQKAIKEKILQLDL